MVSPDDFDRWREDAVTKFVFAAIRKGEEQQREKWMQSSWDAGISDPELLAELRIRADAYNALIETSYEGWCETLETL